MSRDDFDLARMDREDREPARDSDSLPGAPAWWGRVLTSSPARGKFIRVQPITATSANASPGEGSTGTETTLGSVRIVEVWGDRVPALNEYVPVWGVPYRWVTERIAKASGGGAGTGTLKIYISPCWTWNPGDSRPGTTTVFPDSVHVVETDPDGIDTTKTLTTVYGTASDTINSAKVGVWSITATVPGASPAYIPETATTTVSKSATQMLFMTVWRTIAPVWINTGEFNQSVCGAVAETNVSWLQVTADLIGPDSSTRDSVGPFPINTSYADSPYLTADLSTFCPPGTPNDYTWDVRLTPENDLGFYAHLQSEEFNNASKLAVFCAYGIGYSFGILYSLGGGVYTDGFCNEGYFPSPLCTSRTSPIMVDFSDSDGLSFPLTWNPTAYVDFRYGAWTGSETGGSNASIALYAKCESDGAGGHYTRLHCRKSITYHDGYGSPEKVKAGDQNSAFDCSECPAFNGSGSYGDWDPSIPPDQSNGGTWNVTGS